MNKKAKRIFAWCMAIILAVTFIVPSVSLFVSAADDDEFAEEKNQIDQLNSQYKELQEQQTQIQQKINQASTERAKQEAIKEEIVNQIDVTQAQINVLEQRIDLLNDNISQKEEEMDALQDSIDENFELLKKRMRALYMNGGGNSAWGLILGAESYSQMVMRAEVMGRVAEHDEEMIEQMNQQLEELAEIKSGIESDKSRVEADKEEMDQKKDDLDVQMTQAQDKIQDIAAMEREFLANKTELQKQMAQVEAEIRKIYDEINKKSLQVPYTGGMMAWPSATLSQVTSSFGYRFGGSDNHTGIDISGPGAYGSAVLAANVGTVAKVNTSYTNGYGYGIYVILDHGGGIQTLYAHCSAITVSEGDVVATGQKIAEVGSTGWATGPHIHFEVRQNGTPQNPVNWLQG